MEFNTGTLLTYVKTLLDQIDTQIDFISTEARRQTLSPYDMRNPDGTWVLANLLPAKAQLLSTYVLLKAKQERSKSWLHDN